MQRMLILSSDTGEGHNSAARALGETAVEAGWQVSVRKPLEESAAGYRSLGGIYNLLLTYRPGWVGMFAKSIELIKANEANIFYRLVRGYIQSFIESEEPAAIVSVHPMLNHMIQRWISEQNLQIPCYTFVTDPFPPFWKGWASGYVTRYFVLTDEAATRLAADGVEPDRIERVSMPLGSGFHIRGPAEVAELRSALDVEGETILVNGGARGGGRLRRLVHAVLEAAPTANILVVCGHNNRVRRSLDKLKDQRVRTFGFVNDIHRLIGAADLVITKPGALSTYESLASAVPAVLTAIGGLMPQESGLFQAAGDHGFGFGVRTLDELRAVVRQGVAGWKAKREAINRFYRPGSSPNLIDRIQPYPS
jgi:processive 1,2-diacylglycerol beta-glucosyltransferase